MSSNDPIVKGFNNGYTLRKYDPELAEKLYTSFKETKGEYGVGFIEGVKHYRRELVKTKNVNYKIKPSKNMEDRSKTKDKGDREI